MSNKNKFIIILDVIFIFLIIILLRFEQPLSNHYDTLPPYFIIEEPRIYEDLHSYEKIMIHSSDVILQNTKVKELVISNQVAKGSITLDHVEVEKMNVHHEAKQELLFKDTIINTLTIDGNSEMTTLVIGEQSSIHTVDVHQTTQIETSGIIDTLLFKDGVDHQLYVHESGVIDQLELHLPTMIINYGMIQKMEAYHTFSLQCFSEVQELILYEGALDSVVVMEDNANLQFLHTLVPLTLQGTGVIQKAIIFDDAHLLGHLQPLVIENLNQEEKLPSPPSVHPAPMIPAPQPPIQPEEPEVPELPELPETPETPELPELPEEPEDLEPPSEPDSDSF